MKRVMIGVVAAVSALFAGAIAACSSSSSGGPVETKEAGPADSCAPIDSQCGQPCDKGNSLGVGAYCGNGVDCPNEPTAHLCSYLGSTDTHFCTFMCMPADAAIPEGSVPLPTSCGEGATCTCNGSNQCGCTPNTCLGM